MFIPIAFPVRSLLRKASIRGTVGRILDAVPVLRALVPRNHLEPEERALLRRFSFENILEPMRLRAVFPKESGSRKVIRLIESVPPLQLRDLEFRIQRYGNMDGYEQSLLEEDLREAGLLWLGILPGDS